MHGICTQRGVTLASADPFFPQVHFVPSGFYQLYCGAAPACDMRSAMQVALSPEAEAVGRKPLQNKDVFSMFIARQSGHVPLRLCFRPDALWL